MKKRWIIAALVAIFAFAFIGCPTDADDDDSKSEPDKTITFELGNAKGYKAGSTAPAKQTVPHGFKITAAWLTENANVASLAETDITFRAWLLKGTTTNAVDYTVNADITLVAAWSGIPAKLTFKSWDEEDEQDWQEITISSGSTLENEGITLPTANTKPGNVSWGRWEDEFGGAFTINTIVDDDMIITGKWYSNELDTDGTEFEKLFLENGSYAIYEFELSATQKLEDITGVRVSYKAIEAEIQTKQIRNVRLLGPYIYEDFITNVDIQGTDPIPHYGDFAFDANGAPTARFIASGGADDYYRDKNGPYINQNGASWVSPGAANWSTAFGGITIEGNTWFTYTHPFTYTTFTNTTKANVHDKANTRVAANNPGVARKVYFAIGLTSAGTGVGPEQSNGLTSFVKDIKLLVGGAEVPAAIPEFNGNDQVFASYFDPIQFNWRSGKYGDLNDDPVRPTVPEAGDESPYATLSLAKTDVEDYNTSTGAGYFYVNLSDYQTQQQIGAVSAAVTEFTGEGTQGPLVVSFGGSAQNETVVLGLLPKHIGQLRHEDAAANITVTFDATATGANDAGFRFAIGRVDTGANWNATSVGGFASTGSSLSDLNDGITVALDNAARLAADVPMYFVLQERATKAVVLTINSIKVEYVITPPTPAPLAEEDFIWYSSTDIEDGDGNVIYNADAPVITAAFASNWQDLTEINDVGPIVFPTRTSDGEQLYIGSYAKFSIKVKYTNGDGVEQTILPASQFAQIKIGGVDHFGLGSTNPDDGTIDHITQGLVAKYKPIWETASLTLAAQARDLANGTTGWKAELLEIIFYAPED